MNHKILSIPNPDGTERIAGSRTSWVDRFCWEGGRYFRKVYIYPPPFGPLRGLFRNTFLAPSRARREWRALRHLAAAGLQPDLAVGLGERRFLGFLLEARLATQDFGGPDLARRLAAGPLGEVEWTALAVFVRRLHESGLRDPDLVPRNLLLREGLDGPQFAKIDASSSRIVRPGDRWDRARLRDLETLAAGLRRLGAPASEIGRLLARQAGPSPPASLSRLIAAVRAAAPAGA